MLNAMCLNCATRFDAQRSSAKFCSDLCRVQYNRKHTVSEENIPSLPDPDKTFSKSDSDIKKEASNKNEKSNYKTSQKEEKHTPIENKYYHDRRKNKLGF